MKARKALFAVVVVAGLALVTALGFELSSGGGAQSMLAPSGQTATVTETGASSQAASPPDTAVPGAKAAMAASGGSAADGQQVTGSAPAASTPLPTPMIVRTAALDVTVGSVTGSVDAMRALAKAEGAEIADLTYSVGDGGDGSPVPLSAGTGSPGGGQPSTAQLTLRVPADKLDALVDAAGKLGSVQSLNVSAQDVSAQHVDMVARLRNMRAEEARLRQLYAHAGNVSDLLDVEQRLSAVRGDIESAQAELTALEGQVALSTLQVTLSAPGAIVRPADGTSWGLGSAVTRGVQTAVAIVRAFVTGAIAIAPLALLVLVAWGAIALVRSLRRRRLASPTDDGDDEPERD